MDKIPKVVSKKTRHRAKPGCVAGEGGNADQAGKDKKDATNQSRGHPRSKAVRSGVSRATAAEQLNVSEANTERAPGGRRGPSGRGGRGPTARPGAANCPEDAMVRSRTLRYPATDCAWRQSGSVSSLAGGRFSDMESCSVIYRSTVSASA